jgi:carbon storage regulator
MDKHGLGWGCGWNKNAWSAAKNSRSVQEAAVMLVFSRKKNEQIIIDGNIVITVVEIRGDKVRLGIEAPKEVPVHRREIYDAIRKSTVCGD